MTCPPEREKAVQLSDDTLKQPVEKALQADSSLKESSISVKSVNKGLVLVARTADLERSPARRRDCGPGPGP